jgi:hypothetical protein
LSRAEWVNALHALGLNVLAITCVGVAVWNRRLTQRSDLFLSRFARRLELSRSLVAVFVALLARSEPGDIDRSSHGEGGIGWARG